MGAGCCCCCCGNSDAIVPVPETVVIRDKTPIRSVTLKDEVPRIKSSPIRQEYSTMQRFNKIGISTSNPLTLINGYLDEPLLPLEDALKPFDGKINQLSDYIKEAKTKCHYPSEHNLTHDESAAIYIYTMKWDHECLYDHLQAAWKSEDRAKLKPWFKYLKLFKTALDKLPNVKTEIWQGTSYDEKLKEQLSSQSLSLYSSMGSCSPSEKELKEYLEKRGDTKMILVGYKSINGKLVTDYIANRWKEVMVWPGLKLAVAKYVVDDINGSLIIHLIKKPSECYFGRNNIDKNSFV
jgi:hypothetical protein